MAILTTIVIITLSILALIYITYVWKRRRVHILFEVFFLLFYTVSIIIALFPQLLQHIQSIFGFSTRVILYLSILIAYFLIFLIYQKLEDRRVEITKLTREIALLTEKKEKKK